MAVLREEDKAFLQSKFLEELRDEVVVKAYLKSDSEESKLLRELLEEVSSLSTRIKVEFPNERPDDVYALPTVVVSKSGEDGRIRYVGIPAGYEFASLVEDIVMVSKGDSGLHPAVKEEVKKIDKSCEIWVFVTPTCPYCPKAVRLAHQMAFENSNIKADMIEASQINDLAVQYGVFAVPKIVVNRDPNKAFEGALPDMAFVKRIAQLLEG